MASVFTKIMEGSVPCFRLAENELFFAFLDIMPIRPGHTLIVSKLEVDRLWDLPAAYTDQLLTFARPLAKAIQQAFGYDRVNIMTLGFEVSHMHLHLMGMNSVADFGGGATHIKATTSDLAEVHRKILIELEKN